MVTGLFLGERAAFLECPAKAFVQLLQVTVMPYLVTSLISGIASGSSGQARRLFTRAGVIVLVLWALSLALVFVVPLALPPSMGGAFYSTATVSSQERIDWIELYIPSNPFRSLSNNLVPAVVVFSALLGIALIGLRDKDRVLGPLRLIGDTLGRAGSTLVALTPIGIFAIARPGGRHAAAGRVRAIAGISARVDRPPRALHALDSSGADVRADRDPIQADRHADLGSPDHGVRHRESLHRPAADPGAKQTAARRAASRRRGFCRSRRRAGADLLRISERRQAPEHRVHPICRLVHWRSLAVSQFPSLATAGILSNFGSLNVAIPFLLDLVRLPADLFNLFVISSVVTGRFGSAAAVMSTYVFAVLGAFLMTGRRNIDKRRVLTFASVTVVSAGVLAARQPAAARRRADRAGTDRDDVRPSASVRRVSVGDARHRRRRQRDAIPCAAAGPSTRRHREPRHSAGVRVAGRDAVVLPERPR